MWYELRWGITSCLILTVALITVVFYYHPSTRSVRSYFRTVTILPEAGGRVSEVNVISHQDVKIGDVLFKLDPERQEAAVTTARSKVVEVDAVFQVTKAELAAAEHALAEKAATCLHILEEEGTTIVFPRIVEQLAQDMADVADRLDEVQIGLLTQTMQTEVLDTLEQLIGAVQQMQRENEQQQMQPQQSQDEQNTPLLPTSAELKLLRASQLRVNSRTQAIEQTRSEEGASAEGLSKVLEGASRRQMECTEIAEQMRERIDQP